jgi:predicted Ser/Thr protein kinase
VIGLEKQRGFSCLQETDAGKARAGERAVADLEAQRLERFTELAEGVRRRIALQEQRGVEGDAVELAQTADQPRERLARELRFAQKNPPLI